MKSSLRICVVISTVLVLGTSHPPNYHQHPRYYRDQHQPQNHQVHQWPNYQQAAGLAAANQNFQKTATKPTTESTNSTEAIDNNVFIDNETGHSDTANDNSNTISSISKTEPTASTFTKPSEASMKPLAKIVVSNQALDSSNSLEVKSPYVFISPYLKEGYATKESSTFFTKLIGHLIGKKPMNVARTGVKNKTEFEETDDEYLENDEGESETFKKDRMASKADTKLAKQLKERGNKVVDDETNTTEDSEEKISLTSNDASTDEKDTLTPISFVTSLTRNALKGGDNLKDFFNEQRVKDFLLRLI